uniref:Uncharacterized protein n=2 Tax=albitarsis series TaxID=58233 RepID=A0A2M3ZLK6_9DIPT
MYGLTIGMLGATPPVPLPLLLLFVVVDTTELLGSEDELVTLLLLELFVLVLFETALEDVTLSNGVETTGASLSFDELKLLPYWPPEVVFVLPEYPVLLFSPVLPYTFCELFW